METWSLHKGETIAVSESCNSLRRFLWTKYKSALFQGQSCKIETPGLRKSKGRLCFVGSKSARNVHINNQDFCLWNLFIGFFLIKNVKQQNLRKICPWFCNGMHQGSWRLTRNISFVNIYWERCNDLNIQEKMKNWRWRIYWRALHIVQWQLWWQKSLWMR